MSKAKAAAHSSVIEPLARVHWGWPMLAASVIAGLFCFRQLGDTDTGWHLALGRMIWHGQFPRENTLSWAAPHQPWYPTSWLYDVMLYRGMNAGGPFGAQCVTLLLVMLTLFGVLFASWQVNRATGAYILPAVAMLMVPRIVPRPHVASWVIIAWTLAFCMKAVSRATAGDARSWRWRVAALPIIALGSNLHSGAAFAATILGIFAFQAAYEEKRFGREALIVAGAGLALIMNPGGFANLVYLVENTRANDVVPIREMMPASLLIEGSFYALLALVGFYTLAERKHHANLVVAVIFGYLGARTSRFIFEFYLVAAPLYAASAEALFRRMGLNRERAFVAVVTLVGFLSCADGLQAVRFGSIWDKRGIPVRAVQFLNDEGITGRQWNSYHDGGYLPWARPDQPVYLDGRLQAYPPELITDELRAEMAPAKFQARLKDLGIDWVITGAYGNALTGDRLVDSPDWALVYWDEVSEVFLRRDIPRFADVIARCEFNYFHKGAALKNVIFDTLGNANEQVLTAYDRELRHYEKYSPDSYFGLLARCALETRRGGAQADDVCKRAVVAAE